MNLHQIEESATFLKQTIGDFEPEIGIILGTGLGALVNDIEVAFTISYSDIPHFPVSTVEFHSGKLFFGTLSGRKVMCMQGRFHYYEGYSMQQVVYPVRVMKVLGVNTLLVSNAAGGMNPSYAMSDLMIIRDHISFLMPGNPLIGKNLDEMGDRFPDMCDPYDPDLVSKALTIAQAHGIPVQSGVYIGVTGPQLEDPRRIPHVAPVGGGCRGHEHSAGGYSGPPYEHAVLWPIGNYGHGDPRNTRKSGHCPHHCRRL